MAQDTHRTLADMLGGRDYERAKTPKIVGNYRVGKTIGSGAFCKVKTATHLLTKEKFAIKILQPQAPQNWAEVEREIEILRQIQHPNIIRIHDVLWSENKGFIHKFVQFNEVRIQAVKIYIIVELAQGGELWQHISKKGPIDEDMCRKFFRQMVSGLEYCHMHLICHRDLKLENILLDNQNNIKINDFGLSNFIRPGHSMHTFCGTLAYAAPEILSQQAYVGFFVDIWSLGIILFAMLTGDVPWALDDEERKTVELSNLLAGKFRLPAGIVLSRECISLLQIMLQPNPKNRATLAQIRTHPWTNKGFNEPPARVFENYPPVLEIEEPILQQIALLGLNAGKARKSILSNEPCPALCLYHTLLKKQLATKKLLPALVRSAGEPRSPPSNRFASLSVSSAPSPSTPFDMVDDSDDFESRIENSIHDDSDAQNFLQPIDKREKKTKTSSAPSTPTAATSPAFPVYPTITPTTLPPTTPLPNTAPRSPIFTLTSPRSTTIETRRKILTDNPPSNKIYLEPISPTPSRTPPPLSPPSSRTPIALPPPSSPSRVSPTTSASPSSPVFPSASPKRSSGSPKSSSSSPKTPHHKEREAPFGNSSTGTTTVKDHTGETRGTAPSIDEGDEKKKPMFKSLLSKLRGSKLAPLEV